MNLTANVEKMAWLTELRGQVAASQRRAAELTRRRQELARQCRSGSADKATLQRKIAALQKDTADLRRESTLLRLQLAANASPHGTPCVPHTAGSL